MKQFEVSNYCNSCGLCTIDSEYLEENDDGYAVPVVGKYISSDYEKKAKEIVGKCPVGALSLVETEVSSSKEEFIEKAVKQLNSVSKLQEPLLWEFDFSDSDFRIFVVWDADGEWDYKYTTEGSAERAAINEFDRKMYSKIDSILLQLVVEYKSKKLSKYYDDSDSGIYVNNNNQIINTLEEIAGGYENITGVKLQDDFTKFNVFPDRTGGSTFNALKNNTIFFDGIVRKVREKFDSDKDLYSISNYVSYIKIRSTDKYSEGMFGRTKRKTYYCYYSVYDAFWELAHDLEHCFCYAGIEYTAQRYAEEIVKSYNQNVEKKLEEKIKVLKQL